MICLRNLLRNRNVVTACANYSRRPTKIDPGIKHRRRKLPEIDEEEMEDYDDMESDFMDVHMSHKEHEQEYLRMKEREKHHIIQTKYFKEKHPNFLTWHDKEQMKYLHSQDPEEWTVEKLSEGFPALPHVVAKIVKASWTKKNQNRVTNHDKAVQRNWSEFKKGQLDETLPLELKKHLSKFTNRALILKPFEIPYGNQVVKHDNKIEGEFSDIIKTYEKLKNKHVKEPKTNLSDRTPPKGDTFLAVDKAQMKQTHMLTFKQLQDSVVKKSATSEVSSEDKMILLNAEKPNIETIELKADDLADITKHKYETGMVTFAKKVRDYSYLDYPEKIIIPAKLKKKKCLYKLNDCFYDVDGEFLYRVPGMY